MSLVFSVLTAVLLSLLIPATVGAAVRRGDRNGRATARPDADTGALFVVRNRRWQSILFRVVGIVFVVTGGLLMTVGIVESEQMEWRGPFIGGVGIAMAGTLFILLSLGIRRFRVGVFDAHLTVRPWFRASRVVRLTEIGSVRPSPNQYGGIDVRDVSGRKLFTATTITIGYHDIVAYLQERLPRQQTDNPAVPGDVAPWQGATLRAEWFPLPRGRKGTVEPGVLLTAGKVAGNMYVSELIALLNHRTGIVESTNSDPLVLLCWPDAGSPTSTVWELTKDLPSESLALIAEPMDSGLAAVLTGTDLADFAAWIGTLPR